MFPLERTRKVPDGAIPVFQDAAIGVTVYEYFPPNIPGERHVYFRDRDAAKVIAVIDGNILVQRELIRDTEIYTLPGGVLHEDEQVLAAGNRELEEETGYRARYLEVLQVFEPPGKVIRAVHTLIAPSGSCEFTGNLNPDAGEQITPMLLTFDEFLQLRKEPKFRDLDIKLFLYHILEHPEELERFKRRLFGE